MNQSIINRNISRWRAKNVRAHSPRKTRTQVQGYGLKMTQWGQPTNAEKWADFDGLILMPGNVLLDRQESAMLVKDREYFARFNESPAKLHSLVRAIQSLERMETIIPVRTVELAS